MMRCRCFVTAAMISLVMASRASARDILESIVTKSALSSREQAVLENEVSQRIRKLEDAQDNPRDRRAAREGLIQTAKVPNASKTALAIYAKACADELGNLVSEDNLELALDAVLVLTELNHPNTIDALAAAVERSKPTHGAVRYKAAQGIISLHKKLATRQPACRTVLGALGRAGVNEKDEVVLKMLYRAIDFAADAPDFNSADAAADALNTIFESRLRRLARGSHDEWLDEAGYAAAENCYVKASPDRQKRLIKNMARFLHSHVTRHGHKDTAEGVLPTLSRLAKQVEDVIHQMMQASNVSPPSRKVSRELGNRPPTDRARNGAKEALKELDNLLGKPPWEQT